MTTQERKVMELALEALKENQHLVADNQRHAYVMEYNSIIEKCEEALAKTEQEPAAWEQFYPDIGKPQLKQLPQLSQEVVLQYPKEAVDWQKQQKEYAQQLPKETEQEPATKEQIREAMIFNLPLYTTPPQRKPLSDEEILTYRHMIDWTAEWSYINFARAIEAAHGIKEKNTTP